MGIVVLSFGGSGIAGVIRVPEDYPAIQTAIGAALTGDTVSVGPGTYAETIDFMGKAITVASRSGPVATIIDPVSGSAVVFRSGETPSSVLDGFTIQDAGGTKHNNSTYGGGIFCLDSSPTIRSNIIRWNVGYWGGGIACAGSASPQVLENTIKQNSGKFGAGVACVDDASPLFEFNVIEENKTLGVQGQGGGIYCQQQASPAFVSNIIRRNVADFTGSAGGAAFIWHAATPLFAGNVIRANESEHKSAGIYVGNAPGFRAYDNVFTGHIGAGLYVDYGSHNAELIRNRFTNNRPEGLVVTDCENTLVLRNEFTNQPVPLSCYRASLTIDGSTFGSNDYGSILVGPTEVTIMNSVFRDHAGEGIRCLNGVDVRVTNCTIFGNRGGPITAQDSTATILNSILWSNSPSEILENNSTIEVAYSVVEGGYAGEGNLDEDPLLADPGTDEFHLRIGSPCIDAGSALVPESATEDIDGDLRWLGDAIDIGADEFRGDIALRFGYVENQARTVLRINGTRGDHERIVRLAPDDPLRIEMTPSSAGPSPARFALYAWLDQPDETTFTRQPYNLGWTVFPTPLQEPGPNGPLLIWNNLGREPRLGNPDRGSSPAPSVIVDAPNGVGVGVGVGVDVTVQGFIEDNGSRADGPVSITNAILLRLAE